MNRIIRILPVAVLVILIMPAAARAQSDQERNSSLCEKLAERRETILGRFEQRTAALEEAADRRTTSRNDRLNNHSEELVRQRAEADMLRSDSLNLIIEKQAAEDRKDLAGQYAAEIDEAVFARRRAFDDARRQYVETIDNLLLARDKAVRSAVQHFRNSVFDTLDNTASSCASRSGDNSEDRKVFIRNLTNARVGYGDFLRGRTDFREEVSKAKKTRNSAYRKATEEFQKSLQSIRSKYKGRLDGAGL